MVHPTQVHLVGSVPFESAEQVITKSINALPGRLHTIPDGETGSRYYFVLWQSFVFPREVLCELHRSGKPLESTDFECTLDDVKPTKYDEMAIESYQTFRKLRDRGEIPHGVRFQVSVPTPINTVWTHVDYTYRARVEPLYEERLTQDLRKLQDVIPASDLAIQIDAAIEFAYLEYEQGRIQDEFFRPYFGSVRESILHRMTRLTSVVDEDVELGFHLCYGDREHEHFVQPMDSGLLVDIATSLVHRITPKHPVQWIHFPVPKDRLDAAYFEPLKDLDIGHTKLFLGLIHANDQDGTEERMRIASEYYPKPFGVATECGLGRTSLEDVESFYTIARNVTKPALPT